MAAVGTLQNCKWTRHEVLYTSVVCCLTPGQLNSAFLLKGFGKENGTLSLPSGIQVKAIQVMATFEELI